MPGERTISYGVSFESFPARLESFFGIFHDVFEAHNIVRSVANVWQGGLRTFCKRYGDMFCALRMCLLGTISSSAIVEKSSEVERLCPLSADN